MDLPAEGEVPARRIRATALGAAGAPDAGLQDATFTGNVDFRESRAAAGKVTDVRVLSGEPLLRQASINAVHEWVYRPASLDGKPVACVADVTLRFQPVAER